MVGFSSKLLGILVVLGANEASAAVLRASADTRRKARLSAYSFPKFAEDFAREYPAGSAEYKHRAAVFEASLIQVQAVNAKNEREGRSWRAGVHPFMDWTTEERHAMLGYKPSVAHRQARFESGFSFLGSGTRVRTNATRSKTSFRTSMREGGFMVGDGPQIRNQGSCGSCWAISAVEAVEAQLLKNGAASPKDIQLSAQALVDCVPNPQHCGGTGGCDGATGETAYAFMRDHGIPLEPSLPYTGKTEQCTDTTGRWGAAPSRALVAGWNNLPSNQVRPLMEALVSQGPAVVAVEGKSWFDYEAGVFDGCQKDAVLDHAVLAKGYGEDEGKKYWVIQNSWGADWGEQGHIRLLRRDDDDSYCGTDKSPKEGVGCDGGPSEITVCGSCGILFDPVVPTGARLENTADVAATTAAPAAPATPASDLGDAATLVSLDAVPATLAPSFPVAATSASEDKKAEDDFDSVMTHMKSLV